MLASSIFGAPRKYQLSSTPFHMPKKAAEVPYTFAHCLQACLRQYANPVTQSAGRRYISQSLPRRVIDAPSPKKTEEEAAIEKQILNGTRQDEPQPIPQKVPGAMSRRLADATEDALLEGGRAGRKAIEEAGFSDELKTKLLEKIQAQKFQAENAAAFAEANLSSSAGLGTRDIATAQPWQGAEAMEDSVRRMLSDAHKPLKPELRGGRINAPVVDLRIKKEPKKSSGQRLANARDKTSIYAISKDSQMSEKEREAMRKELKERFTPGARAMPTTLQGLASLANERIEDAIARGQFKNIPRGKAIERDARPDNPFIDTTEYIMNKMIQRQDIVPPWIEKQQELVRTARSFRSRLRADWKRHAARIISSRGGSLHEQVKLAERYAESERRYNPKKESPVEEMSVATKINDEHVLVKITETIPETQASGASTPVVQVTLQTERGEVILDASPALQSPGTAFPPPPSNIPTAPTNNPPPPSSVPPPPPQSAPLPAPFRDAAWEKAELSYLTLAVKNLNDITRSYNLMAPDIARKPYYSLERELKSCYADMAPQLAQAIVERAAKPEKELVVKVGHRPGGVMEQFSTHEARVWDEKKKPYGFKEFWKDLFVKDR